MADARAGSSYGLMAEYASAAELMKACALVRAAGYRRWDAYSPFLVQGLARAMGLETSRAPWVALVCGLGGAGLALVGQLWASSAPTLPAMGRALEATWPALVPITVEVGLLCGALGALCAVLWLSRLPRWHHPLFGMASFDAATDDGFFIAIEASDPRYDAEATAALLRETGARSVEVVVDV